MLDRKSGRYLYICMPEVVPLLLCSVRIDLIMYLDRKSGRYSLGLCFPIDRLETVST